MTLRKRGYLIEASDRELWDKYKGDPGDAKMMRSLGFDPEYQPKRWKGMCPECGQKEVVVKERHADTDMNYMEHRCLVCNYRKEV